MKMDEFREAVEALKTNYVPFRRWRALSNPQIGFIENPKVQNGEICCAIRARRYQEILDDLRRGDVMLRSGV